MLLPDRRLPTLLHHIPESGTANHASESTRRPTLGALETATHYGGGAQHGPYEPVQARVVGISCRHKVNGD
jgi:hypothetical protein